MYQNAQLFIFDVEFHIQRQDRIKAECYMEINLKKIGFEFEAKKPPSWSQAVIGINIRIFENRQIISEDI